MQKIERILWIILISFIIFFLIPSFGYLMSSTFVNIFAKICVLFINVIYSFLVGVVLAKKGQPKWYYSLIIGILFIISSLLLYNFSTIYFSIIYILLELIGSLLFCKSGKKSLKIEQKTSI